MKTNPEIIRAIEEAKIIVETIYKYDPRIYKKNQEIQTGINEETKIVFKEVLRYLLNQKKS